VTPCITIHIHQRSGGKQFHHLQRRRVSQSSNGKKKHETDLCFRRRFGGKCYPHLHVLRITQATSKKREDTRTLLTVSFALLSNPEDGRNMFIRNVAEHQISGSACCMLLAGYLIDLFSDCEDRKCRLFRNVGELLHCFTTRKAVSFTSLRVSVTFC
jgi:hypothetical protein